MKKTHSTKFLYFYYILILFALFYIVYTSVVYLRVFDSSRKCRGNENQELLRIKIYGSSSNDDGSTISGTFSIIDSNGNEIAVIERSWSGSYLSVDFSQVKINNRYYIFPTRIFGKNRIFDIRKTERNGTDLSRYYIENNQCMLLGYGSTLRQRKSMYKIANFTLKKNHVFDFSKRITILSVDLSNCRTEFYYSISSTGNGDLIIQEL